MNEGVQRIGIYAGTFDPVHIGHISFALKALKQANLSEIYFLTERKPRYKTKVTPINHRLEMLKIATEQHSNLKTIALDEDYFTINQTVINLKQLIPNKKLVFCLGLTF